MKSAIIILAAGSSSRMGRSKQLLKIGKVTMLEHAIHIAREAGDYSVLVVLGADEEKHKKEISHLGVDVVSNPHWKNGIGSSIKAGLGQALRKHPDTGSVLILVCDQPLLTSVHIKNLIAKEEETDKAIIASRYAGVAGVPALFNRILFPELASISDDHGAKKIIQNHPSETFLVDFPEGSIDLDTPDEYKTFIS